MHPFIDITQDNIGSLNVEAAMHHYRTATSSGEALVNALGRTAFTVEAPLPRIHDLWRDPKAALYARCLMANLPLLPALVEPFDGSFIWLMLSQRDTGIRWIDGPPANVEIDPARLGACFDRMEALMAPALSNLDLQWQQSAAVRSQMLKQYNGLIEALQTKLEL